MINQYEKLRENYREMLIEAVREIDSILAEVEQGATRRGVSRKVGV